MTPPKAPRRTPLPADARKQQLLDAAATVLLNGRSGGFTIDAVAAAADVDRTLIHYHFKTRDRLLLALYQREHDRMDQLFADELARAEPTHEARLRAFVHAWLDLADSQSVISAFEGVQTESGELETMRARDALAAAHVVAAEIESAYALDTVEAQVVAGIVLGASTTLVATWRLSGWDRDRIEDLFRNMMIAAIQRACEVLLPPIV